MDLFFQEQYYDLFQIQDYIWVSSTSSLKKALKDFFLIHVKDIYMIDEKTKNFFFCIY